MPSLHWIGKDKVVSHHMDVPYRVLDKSYSFGEGEAVNANKIIHGDNLEALKALLPEYEGRVDCVYIDPPYNTGNEGWVYNDNVSDPKIERWLHEVVGREGEDISRHDKWLCMMYPRLALLKRLLSDRGSIWISIDDNEQANLKLVMDAGAKPEWRYLAFVSAISATTEEAKRLSGGSWGDIGVDAMADFGRTDLLAAFGPTIKHDTKELPELVQRAKDQTAVFDAYDKKAAIPLAGKVVPAELQGKKGGYTLTLDSWSPWMDVDPILDLKKYPVAVYVPKEYDGSKPYGLVVSMMNAKGSSQQPKPEYLASLSARHLLYVGFDPYNRVFEDGSNDEYRFNNHERLVLAAVYHMLGAYSVDRSRIYLTGFSWGGRLTGEIVPKWPNIFSGGIAVCGCFTSGERLIPSYRYGRDRVTIVGASSDWDYNRAETRNGCNLLASLGYETYYLQDPQKWHSRISGENFEKALGLLDAAAARRSAGRK